MPFLDVGRSGTALLWAGSREIPNGIELGNGSSAKTNLTSGLVTPILFRPFTSTDSTTPRFYTMTADYSSTEMSGLTFREFAVKASGGSYWSAEGLPPITFDGSSELQIQTSWETY